MNRFFLFLAAMLASSVFAAPPQGTVIDACVINGKFHQACVESFNGSQQSRFIVTQGPGMQNCQQGGGQNCAAVQAQITPKKDPLTDPDAVPHHIDRSAMELQIQGWTRDLKYPVYPVQVQAGGNGTYYTTKESVKKYHEFDFDELRCEIGDAPKAVLTAPTYACADGVCMSKEGGIVGTDPRLPVNKKHKC